MEPERSRKRSRSHLDDGEDLLNDVVDDTKHTEQKKVRFPKGKKVKPEGQAISVPEESEDGTDELPNTHAVAKARSQRRKASNRVLDDEEGNKILNVVAAAEVNYEDNDIFVEDGVQIEPFNLTKEREEGYFDESGNYVEYLNNKEIKDAWLDSVEIATDLAPNNIPVQENVETNADLSSQEIAAIKRRIADVLEPGETILQALRRLKGHSNNRKEKMSPETKRVFDQLTEDAMKLMDDGDYNVYQEKQEVFQREAEGFERLARARGEGSSTNSGNMQPSVTNGIDATANTSTSNGDDAFDMFADNAETATGDPAPADAFDMFADDAETATGDPAPVDANGLSGSNPDLGGALLNDYIFDETSGYYYSSSLGYYYDPSSGLYCYAASGQWFSYNPETGAYEEVPTTGEAA